MGEQLEKEITIRDVLLNSTKWIKYLLSKWIFILLFTLGGIIIGFISSYFFKEKFVSEISFVIEDNSGSLNSNSGIGAAFGLGGPTSNGGLFSSINNIIWLYSSNKMLENTLLSYAKYPDGSNKLLINDFINTSESIKEFLTKYPNLKKVTFTSEEGNLSKEQAILLKKCVSDLVTDYIKIDPVENTDNIVKVTFKGENENFAYAFSQKLVELVNDFYISTKTQSAQDNVNQLTQKADSLKQKLDNSMVTTASSADNTPYPNPSMTILKVEPQKNNVDVQANTTMYLQVVQSLENAKNELAKQKPIIKIIDSPLLPLRKEKKNPFLFVIFGAIFAISLAIITLILKKIYKDPNFGKN